MNVPLLLLISFHQTYIAMVVKLFATYKNVEEFYLQSHQPYQKCHKKGTHVATLVLWMFSHLIELLPQNEKNVECSHFRVSLHFQRGVEAWKSESSRFYFHLHGNCGGTNLLVQLQATTGKNAEFK